MNPWYQKFLCMIFDKTKSKFGDIAKNHHYKVGNSRIYIFKFHIWFWFQNILFSQRVVLHYPFHSGLRLPSRQSSQLRTGGPGFKACMAKIALPPAAPGACKIRRGYNILHVPFQILPLGEPSPPWRIKIAMACVRIILRQTVGNSALV